MTVVDTKRNRGVYRFRQSVPVVRRLRWAHRRRQIIASLREDAELTQLRVRLMRAAQQSKRMALVVEDHAKGYGVR